MIRLHPRPEPFLECPHCHALLRVNDWYIPGMRSLAEMECPDCSRIFYGDLLAGHALYFPMLLDRTTGNVHDRCQFPWFANLLKESYAARSNTPMEMLVEEFREIKRPLLLNCLDVLYGHSLLKLLNAQYYIDQTPEYDLILLLPKWLRWMAPEGAAAIWTVDLPLRQGSQWNDWLAANLHARLDGFPEVHLGIALAHPHQSDFDISRFTKISPFSIENWDSNLGNPTVTFIWREDRLWASKDPAPKRTRAFWRSSPNSPDPILKQKDNLVALATELQRKVRNLRFAAAGVGKPGGLPAWILDLRKTDIDATAEKMWCEQYSQSHVIIGVHGSNMLLPSAHACTTVELVPSDRWGNIVQDILPTKQDLREALVRCRFLPLDASVTSISEVILCLLGGCSDAIRYFKPPWSHHEIFRNDPSILFRKRCDILKHRTPVLKN